MIRSTTEPSTHFIAINFHRYHDLDSALNCCASVKRSVDMLLKNADQRVSIVLFSNSSRIVHSESLERVKELGIEVRALPESTNGDSLNLQIDTALEEGFDFFYRVDADDLVSEHRFPRQAEILTNTLYDICGGGLIYRNAADGTGSEVVPPQSPTAASFMFNLFFLHPTLAFRLKTFRTHGIRYWPHRLEDKNLALQARSAGLRIYNDPYVYGEYSLNPKARNTREAAKANLMLNLKFLILSKSCYLMPVALGLYILRLMVSAQTLRNLRDKLLWLQSQTSLFAFSRSKAPVD